MALNEAIKEYLYLISVIKQLNIENKEKFYLFTDSLSAIGLANNPEYYAKTKHIDIQYHFIREYVINDIIQLSHISIKEQLADVLTKALSGPTFKYLVK
jgi:N-acetylglucosamine-6-phosphate deacetylase